MRESGTTPLVQAEAGLCLTSNSIAQKEGHTFSDLALFAFASIPFSDDYVRIGKEASIHVRNKVECCSHLIHRR